jgi:hypothetical protein
MLQHLPQDLLCHVLGFLGARSMMVAACTCKEVRRVVDSMPLHIVAVGTNNRMRDWMALPHVQPRITSLAIRRTAMPSMYVAVAGNPEAVAALYCKVGMRAITSLPITVQYLDLQRVDCYFSPSKVFDMRTLAFMPQLHTLKLTFTEYWRRVDVTGLGALSKLDTLVLRGAPSLVVWEPLRARHVHLHATERMACGQEVWGENVTLECDAPLDPSDALTDKSVACLRHLTLRCPGSLEHVPSLAHMARLESLTLHLDWAVLSLSDLVSLAGLRSLDMHCRFGAAVATTGTGSLPKRVKVRMSVGGVPEPAVRVDKLFQRT